MRRRPSNRIVAEAPAVLGVLAVASGLAELKRFSVNLLRSNLLIVASTLALMLFAQPALATTVFLSTSTTPGSVVHGESAAINTLSGGSGSLGIWAIPDASQVLTGIDLNLRIEEGFGNSIDFTSVTVENPLISGGPARRWFDNGTVSGVGFDSVAVDLVTGMAGTTTVGTGTPGEGTGLDWANGANDPLYDATTGAYLFATVNYNIIDSADTSDLYLQIGDAAVADTGGLLSSVILGLADSPLDPANVSDRTIDSATQDAFVTNAYQWIGPSLGTWNTSSNWSPTGIPSADNASAHFTGLVAGTVLVQVNVAPTIHRLEIDNNSEYRFIGGSQIILDSQSGLAEMDVSGLGHRTALKVRADSDTHLTVAAGGELTMAGVFEFDTVTVTKQGAGKLYVNGLPGTGSGTLDVAEGVLGGTGTVNGDLMATAGTVAPGTSVGELDVAGDFTLAAGGTLQIEIDGVSSFDLLSVVGTANLGGSLDVVLNYQPTLGTQFLVVNAGTLVDTGLTLTGPNAGLFDVDFVSNTLVLEYSATPGDFNMDGFVDGFDFLLWQRDMGVGDLADWEANYGASLLVASAAAVPEPGAWVLVLSGVLAGLVVFKKPALPEDGTSGSVLGPSPSSTNKSKLL